MPTCERGAMIEGYLETRELAAEALHRMAVCFANLGGVEQMKDVFDQFDLDGSGGLDLEEFGLALERFGAGVFVSRKDVHTIFDVIDSDGNGVLDIEEFATMADCEMKLVLAKQAAPHLKINKLSRDTILHHAIGLVDDAAFGRLVKKRPHLVTNDDGTFKAFRPLHIGAIEGRLGICRVLLDNGAPVNDKAYKQMTPLHWAAKNGHEDVCHLLLDRGASVNCRAHGGKTVLSFAVDSKMLPLCRRLLAGEGKQKAKVSTADKKEQLTPLHYAAIRGDYEIAELLLKEGADVTARSADGHIPLHGAAAQGHADVCRLLIVHDSYVNAKDREGHTPFDYAVLGSHGDTCMELTYAGCNITKELGTASDVTFWKEVGKSRRYNKFTRRRQNMLGRLSKVCVLE